MINICDDDNGVDDKLYYTNNKILNNKKNKHITQYLQQLQNIKEQLNNLLGTILIIIHIGYIERNSAFLQYNII